jgi:predicted DsbA family dithiol-disulfide isomerase
MMWNTFAAHKLLVWAGEVHGHDRQTALKLALFEAHFNARRPIGERDVLLDVAEETGFDREAAGEALDSKEWAHKVRAEESAAYDLNVTGVPAMVVENAFMIPGAQSPQVYRDALRRVAEKIPT